MIEVTFTESAGGSLKCAKSLNGKWNGAVSVLLLCDDGSQPTAEEIEKARQEAEAKIRRRYEQAVPVEGSPRDVYCFPLGLSMGDISGEILGLARQSFLQSMILIDDPAFDTVAQESMDRCREELPRLLEKARAGDSVRVWYSDQPEELCGMCWLMSMLEDSMDIRMVKLPSFTQQENTVIQYTGWGEVAPEEWSNFVKLEQPVSSNMRRYFTHLWQQMVRENAPLRAVLNGKLVSVEESFYDGFIHRELERMENTFREAIVVGNVLGKYQLGISDWWVHSRIQKLVDDGRLSEEETCGKGNPAYHRLLKKA